MRILKNDNDKKLTKKEELELLSIQELKLKANECGSKFYKDKDRCIKYILVKIV